MVLGANPVGLGLYLAARPEHVSKPAPTALIDWLAVSGANEFISTKNDFGATCARIEVVLHQLNHEIKARELTKKLADDAGDIDIDLGGT